MFKVGDTVVRIDPNGGAANILMNKEYTICNIESGEYPSSENLIAVQDGCTKIHGGLYAKRFKRIEKRTDECISIPKSLAEEYVHVVDSAGYVPNHSGITANMSAKIRGKMRDYLSQQLYPVPANISEAIQLLSEAGYTVTKQEDSHARI